MASQKILGGAFYLQITHNLLREFKNTFQISRVTFSQHHSPYVSLASRKCGVPNFYLIQLILTNHLFVSHTSLRRSNNNSTTLINKHSKSLLTFILAIATAPTPICCRVCKCDESFAPQTNKREKACISSALCPHLRFVERRPLKPHAKKSQVSPFKRKRSNTFPEREQTSKQVPVLHRHHRLIFNTFCRCNLIWESRPERWHAVFRGTETAKNPRHLKTTLTCLRSQFPLQLQSFRPERRRTEISQVISQITRVISVPMVQFIECRTFPN
jgi:hypothetical protein